MEKGWYKTSVNKLEDFSQVDVRRINGILLDFKDLSSQALNEMEKWLINGEKDITFDEAKERLNYYLTRLGLNN